MEQINSIYQLLELISRPAFCVKDSIIQYANQAARTMGVAAGTAIEALLAENSEAYKHFESGCLNTTVTILGIPCGASVTKSADMDVFTLDDAESNQQLRTLSLAGQQLRIPLANLAATIDSILLDHSCTSSAIQKYNDSIRRGIHQLHRIINNMSDTAYLNSGTPTEDLLNISATVDEIIEKSQSFLQDAGVTLHYKGLTQSVYTMGNRTLLERAILNMLSNAVKFSVPQSPISVEISQTDDKILLTVGNHCKNINPEMLSTAFASYQRMPSVEDSRKGIGLGMPLIRAVAQAHGGAVLIDQPQPDYIRVTLTLKIQQRENPTTVYNPLTRILDYSGGKDHALLELSDILPAKSYQYEIE